MRRVLLLYRHPPGTAMRPAILAHLKALERAAAGTDVRVEYHNAFDESPSLALRRTEPDAVVLHTTFLCMRWSDHFPLFHWAYRWLADLPCRKLAIPQDEYDHAEILDEWLEALGATDVFTNFDERRRELIYPRLSRSAVRFHEVLTGYIDEGMATYAATRVRPPAERPLDVVYRASNLPYWFGAHGQLKHGIAEVVEQHARRKGLRTDISTSYDDVLYGDAWTDFLLSGRTVIGAESGSSALDRRGEVQAAFRALLAAEPGLTFEEASARLPPGWDGNDLGAISPRHFEAVVTRTCQVLVEGTYSGVLEADRHYLPLRRDFGNVDEVLDRIRDDDVLSELTERAYEEVYLSGRYTYDAFGALLLETLEGARSPRVTRRAVAPVLVAAAPHVDRAARGVRAAATGAMASTRGGTAGLPGALRLPARALRRIRLARLPAPVARRAGGTVAAGAERTCRHGRHLVLIAASLAAGARRVRLERLVRGYVSGGRWRHTSPRTLAGDLLRLGVAERNGRLGDVRLEPEGGSLEWRGERQLPLDPRDPTSGAIAFDDETGGFHALNSLVRRYPRAAAEIGRGRSRT